MAGGVLTVGTPPTSTAWSAHLEQLRPLADLAALSWMPGDPLTQAEVRRQLMMSLSLAYFCYFQSTPKHPDFLPFRSSVHTLQPNPDDAYLKAQLDGAGTYRVSGDRGTVHLLTFTISCNVLGFTDEKSEMLLEFDGDEVTEADGRIDLVLSAERPAGHKGAWMRLPRKADSLIVRQRCYRWGEEQDARLAITRLDPVPLKPRLTAAEIGERIDAMIAFAGRMTRFWLTYLQGIQARPAHQIEATSFAGGVQAQQYWLCRYELAADEALIFETELPARVRYWNLQLNDMIWNTVEYIYRQSSLNGAQAALDPDGRFRAVIALHDPGVPNWLDTGGNTQGTLVGRWYESDTHPVPTLRKVKLAELRAHLPSSTPHVSQDERSAALLQRARSAQLRRRW